MRLVRVAAMERRGPEAGDASSRLPTQRAALRRAPWRPHPRQGARACAGKAHVDERGLLRAARVERRLPGHGHAVAQNSEQNDRVERLRLHDVDGQPPRLVSGLEAKDRRRVVELPTVTNDLLGYLVGLRFRLLYNLPKFYRVFTLNRKVERTDEVGRLS